MKKVLFLTTALLLSACGGAQEKQAHASDCPESDGLTIQDAWARAAGDNAMSAAYLTICNGAGAEDALISAKFAGSKATEIHQTSTGDDGLTKMSKVAEVAIPAGGKAALKPGGAHIMLMGLGAPLPAGEEATIELTFKQAGTITTTLAIRDKAGAH